MSLETVLQELESLGTAQNRKIYTRHGVGENQFGVSVANLKNLQKKYKKNNDLAKELWATGNHDARYLATMIIDPKTIDGATLDAWVQDLNNYYITDTFAGMVSTTPFARQKAEAWKNSEQEFIGQAGWNLIAMLAGRDEAMEDEFFQPILGEIASHIHERKNRVRYSMNMALIAIATRNSSLTQEGMTVAQTIGEVYVDHGATGCETPFAPDYIQKTVEYKKSKGKWE